MLSPVRTFFFFSFSTCEDLMAVKISPDGEIALTSLIR